MFIACNKIVKIAQSIKRHRQLLSSLGIDGYVLFQAQVRSDALSSTLRHRLRARESVVPLFYRPGQSDLEAFIDIFVNEQYAAVGPIDPHGLILDCGANVGYSVAWFLSRYPHAHVVAVEPDGGNYQQLLKNVAPFGKAVTAMQAGVWSSDCGLTFDENNYRDGLGWSIKVREALPGEAAAVRGMDIPALMALRNATEIALLKMDIERSEIEVFGPSSQAWIPKCDKIAIELHDDECEKTFFGAIDGHCFSVRRSGELTICERTSVGRSFCDSPR